jgi:hypothetical protein
MRAILHSRSSLLRLTASKQRASRLGKAVTREVVGCVHRLQDRLMSNYVSIRGFQSRLVADACGAPVLRDQGPDRPAGHGKAERSLGDGLVLQP